MFDKVWTLPRAIEMLVENPSFPDTKNKQKKPKISPQTGPNMR